MHTGKTRTLMISLCICIVAYGCSANTREANSIKSRVIELSQQHPVNETIARIHYVAGNIAIIGEEEKISIEVEPVSELKGITIAFFGSQGLKVPGKNVRHYKKIDTTKIMRDTIRFKPNESGEHSITVYILLMTAKHGTVARELIIPIRSGH